MEFKEIPDDVRLSLDQAIRLDSDPANGGIASHTSSGYWTKRVRRVRWTWFKNEDPSHPLCETRFRLFVNMPEWAFVCWGHETCPSTGRFHYQGYGELKAGVRMYMRSLCLKWPGLSLFFCDQPQAPNIAYTKKDGGVWESVGAVPDTPNVKRSKTHKARISKLALDTVNKPLAEVIDEEGYPWIHYDKLMRFGRALAPLKPLVDNPIMVWLYGEPDVGKTTEALRLASEKDPAPHVHHPGMHYFDINIGYPKCIIFDDVHPTHFDCAFVTLIKLMGSRLPVWVNVKNAGHHIRPEYIIFTSNFSPGVCFEHARLLPVDRRALLSRLTYVKRCEKGNWSGRPKTVYVGVEGVLGTVSLAPRIPEPDSEEDEPPSKRPVAHSTYVALPVPLSWQTVPLPDLPVAEERVVVVAEEESIYDRFNVAASDEEHITVELPNTKTL